MALVDGTAQRILVVDDNPFIGSLLRHGLSAEGYEVVIALDAETARKEFTARSPDLVVIDMMISGGEGLMLCRELRSGGQIQVLALSTIDLRSQALDAGAQAFLGKPLEPLRLVSTIRDLLGTSALTRRAEEA